MKQSLLIALLAIVVMVFASGTLRAQQNLKIGFVNSAKILQEYPEALDANKKLDVMGKQWQSELEQMSRDLQSKYEQFQKKEALLTEDQKRSQREELVTLEQRGVQFRQEKFGSDGDLAHATDSLMRPIKNHVMKIIEAVAKEQKIQFMFDRNDQILVLLYGDQKFDYTNLVIDRLKRGTK